MTTKIKFIIKLILPPFIIFFYKKIRHNPNVFEGIYNTFEEVPVTSEYNNEATQNQIKENLTILLSDYKKNIDYPKAEIRSQITNLLPLLISLIDKEKVSILDFGGSAGETYIDCMNKLKTKKRIDYFLYDFEETINIGRKLFLGFKHKYLKINFINKLSEVKKFDIIYFGSSLQYFSDYKSILLAAISKNPRYIFLTDNFMVKNHSTYATAQVNIPGKRTAYWIFKFDDIVSFFSENNYSLIYVSSNFQPYHTFDNFPDENKVTDTSNLLFKKNFSSTF
jgi:putative methyltransferase (TIGR04325 family)